MKRLLLLAIGGLTLFSTGCDEGFELTAPYKNVTLVYAMLDANLDTNYVRIQKAFVDDSKSAIDMAKVADSLYYPEGAIDVKIKEFSGSALVSTMDLVRVTLPKDSGTFANNPAYAYRYVKILNPANTYRLVIRNNNTGEVDSSETAIISNDTVNQSGFYISAFSSLPPENVAFARISNTHFKYKLPVKVGPPAKILQGIIRFYYWEVNNNTGSETPHSLDFPFATTVIENSPNATLEAHNSAFYDFFKENLSAVPANVKRYLDYCDIFVYAGSNDYVEYLKLAGSPSNNLTSNEIKPIYSNLKGPNVIGLFTTRGQRIGRNIEIEPITFDSLAAHPDIIPTGIQPEKWYK